MKLFDVLPHNLFSILSSKNKEIYVEALLVLRKAFKQEMIISKSDLVSRLIDNLDETLLGVDLTEGYPEDGSANEDEKNSISLSGTAHYILRRFKETGWIEDEYGVDSFEELITLPDYSVKLLNLLYSITDESVKEYNSYVYSTYSVLKTAQQDKDDYMYNALATAYENTVRLVDELKTLHNNIRRYHQTLNEYVTVNEVLKGHFDEYKNLIMDKIYHPLKTLDSVPRFRTPILKILEEWLADGMLRARMEEQAMLRGKYTTKEEATEDIILKIGEIIDTYESLDEMLEAIDRKNSAYTRASIERMRYLLNTDKSIKGKLVELLTRTAQSQGDEETAIVQMLADGVQLFKQGYLDEKSLYVRAVRNKKSEVKPLEVRTTSDEEGEKDLAEFIHRAKKSYSHARIIAFVKEVMAGLNVIKSNEISLPDDEAFVLLMLASLKGQDKNVFYKVEYMDGYVENNGYRIPQLRLTRKES